MNAGTINWDGGSGEMIRLRSVRYQALCFAHVFKMFIRQRSDVSFNFRTADQSI